MTVQEAIADNPCVACLSSSDQESIITYAALQWLTWLESNGGSGGSVTITPQEALAEASCVDCVDAGEQRAVKTIAALALLQWIEDNP